MENPISYYKERLKTYQDTVKNLQKKLYALSMLRLAVFILVAIGIYLALGMWQVAVAIGLVGILVFIHALLKYTDTKREHAFYKALVAINETELQIGSGDFLNRATGLEYQDAKHVYSLDIDLFGRGSFFQYLNRTTVADGTHKLSSLLKANNTANIKLRQEAIQELRNLTKWRQHYAAKASLVQVETPANQIVAWLKAHQTFLPKVMAWIPLVFGVVSVLLFFGIVFNFIERIELIGYWLFLGLALSGIYLKKINVLAMNTDKVRDTFRQYAELLNMIEDANFTTQLLVQKQAQIQSQEKKASKIFKSFSRALDALDNRNNLIGAIFGNGLFLTDIRNSFRIERWITTYGSTVTDWLEVVAFFDAFNSLGNYAFNHPDHVVPDITDEKTVMNVKNLGHPLIDSKKRITSDLLINQEQFFIVTGANMAGKSTFLRTVSLHIVMANVGLPVCATSSVYYPVKLITSMRTSDSLTDDSSYFFSELTRLKFIVDQIAIEPYFIVLDEILKGTNSTDKAIGSKKFVEKLVASKATGIIATHDLSLCEIEQELHQVKNYYFDAEIVNDELYFDYKLKKGICQNMNASFLLKKMNIV